MSRPDDSYQPTCPEETPSPAEAIGSERTEGLAATPGKRRPTLAPGQLVGGRYRIVRYIAHGGAGEVYEADDQELGSAVALKIIRPQLEHSDAVLRRFRREIQLSRKVTHANVCRIFDIGFHSDAQAESTGPAETASGEVPELLFLTMELIRGETLTERLQRRGKMTPEQAMPYVAQMAAALAAAHDVGVIHRDFKSGNVMVVDEPNGPHPRVVVTDFGLARQIASQPDVLASLTEGDELLGTPAYMAPEQIEGEEISPATDIYALGIVMYEMLTGKRPFAGKTALSTALKRLRDAPPPLRRHVRKIDPRWEAVVLRCLERNPSNRFSSAGDVVLALEGELPVRRPRLRDRRRLMLAGGLGIAALIAGSVLLHLSGKPRRDADLSQSRAAPVPGASPRRSVALLGFRNLSQQPEADWLSTALSEMLAMELGIEGWLRVVPGESVARMKAGLGLADTESFSTKTLARIRTGLGVDMVVAGSYYLARETRQQGRELRFDLRVQDALTGEAAVLLSERGSEEELLDLVARAGARLREKLGVRVSASGAEQLRSSHPANIRAVQLHAEGLAKLRLFDARAARELLLEATATAPTFAMAHAALARAWAELGYDNQARDAARTAFELSGQLPRQDQLLVEGRYREMAQQWPEAMKSYQALFEFYPDNVEYGLRLAAVQNAARDGNGALKTVERLRKLPEPAGTDPRIDLAEAEASQNVSDFARQLQTARRAHERGSAQGARLVVARALRLEGAALRSMGLLQEAGDTFARARSRYQEAGDRGSTASLLTETAGVFRLRGEHERARALLEEALKIHRQTGNRKAAGIALSSIALSLREQGSLARAREMFEEALVIAHEFDDPLGVGICLTSIGITRLLQGDLPGAVDCFQETLARSHETGNRLGIAISHTTLGNALLEQGDLVAARDHFQQALTTSRQLQNRRGVAHAEHALGLVLTAEGSLPQAREMLEQALATREEMGEGAAAAESRLALAELAAEEGNPELAVTLARRSVEELGAQHASDRQTFAMAVLGRALLLQGEHDESRHIAHQAVERSQRSENFPVRLQVQIAAARALASSGQQLEEVVAEASAAGFLQIELEARLALAELAASSGAVVLARGQIEALEQAATARGFGLVARKARLLAAR